MEEGYVKKHRRKPLHRTMIRKRSLLRNGTELRSFKDFMGESTPRSVPPGTLPNDAHEVNWLRNSILLMKPEYTRQAARHDRHGTKPAMHKHIIDLERQIKERGGVPDDHDWIRR